MIICGSNRAPERLDNGLCRLKRVPPAPLSHPLLDQLVAEVRIGNLTDDLESTEISLKVNAFGHRWGHKNRRLLAAEMLVEDVLSILRPVGEQALALDVLHDVVRHLIGMAMNDAFLFRVRGEDLTDSLSELR